MLQINKIETFLVDLPTIRPHVLSMATMHRQTIVIVRIHCSDGIVGIGEGTTIGGLSYGDESPESIKLAIDTYFAPDPQDLRSLPGRPDHGAIGRVVVGNHFAKSAVETALLDAMGKRVGLPVSELLGGRHRDALPVAWTLASGDTDKDIEEAERMLSLRRHSIFKLKIGKRAVADDVAHVAAIKRALGDRASVRVDVNQAWDEASAARGLAMLEAAGVDLVEQPIAKANRAGLARLAARFIIPIMADEALHGPDDAFDLARRAAADVFAVKIAQSGGLQCRGPGGRHRGCRGHRPLRRHDARGRRRHDRLGACVRDLPPARLGHRAVRSAAAHRGDPDRAARLRRFRAEGADRPGLGVELDPDRIAFFRRDRAGTRTHSFPANTKPKRT